MDAVFKALASPVRRRMLDVLKQHPGCSVREVAERFDVSRVAILKHLGVLAQAELVLSEKVGRTRRLYFNAVPIQMIYDRWTTEYSALWAAGLTGLKYKVETKGKSKWPKAKGKSSRSSSKVRSKRSGAKSRPPGR